MKLFKLCALDSQKYTLGHVAALLHSDTPLFLCQRSVQNISRNLECNIWNSGHISKTEQLEFLIHYQNSQHTIHVNISYLNIDWSTIPHFWSLYHVIKYNSKHCFCTTFRSTSEKCTPFIAILWLNFLRAVVAFLLPSNLSSYSDNNNISHNYAACSIIGQFDSHNK